AELLFYWPSLERQVRISGKVTKISEQESTDYYHKRPRDSQIAAHISTPQSGVIADREALQSRFEDLPQQVGDQEELAKPVFRGGYRLEADYYECWQG
ncbi:pyridoxamine 5'-phosphate oxidase family protein, partial [Acinetobacter ursingii]|uniref:pyridoxamine 5'-phosphate oxidase family protein n=1 Tax=Acinetobacter ursingii TaxID=108980 RepID=UPI003AF5426E